MAVCFVLILLALVECNPRYHPQPAFSAASYESLGIQPGDRPSRSLGEILFTNFSKSFIFKFNFCVF